MKKNVLIFFTLIILIFFLTINYISGFSNSRHRSITREVLSEFGFKPLIIYTIINSNLLTDTLDYIDAENHFLRRKIEDSEFAYNRAINLINTNRELIIENIKNTATQSFIAGTDDYERCLDILGHTLHTIQDAFSHTNYEMRNYDKDGCNYYDQNFFMYKEKQYKFIQAVSYGNIEYDECWKIQSCDIFPDLCDNRDNDEKDIEDYTHSCHTNDNSDDIAYEGAYSASYKFVQSLKDTISEKEWEIFTKGR